MTREEILAEIAELEAELERGPSDHELLEWARENHPEMIRLRQLRERLDQLYSMLEEIEHGQVGSG